MPLPHTFSADLSSAVASRAASAYADRAISGAVAGAWWWWTCDMGSPGM